MTLSKIAFGAGCFWGVEAAFRQLTGVTETAVGYMGGTTANPTYKDVCTGETNHAEVVLVTFDSKVIEIEKVLETFWANHDPCQKNRQGPDVGTQYRSVIFYYDDAQKEKAETSRDDLQKSDRFKNKLIVTDIQPAPTFYIAEDYHQQYLEKRGLLSCHI